MTHERSYDFRFRKDIQGLRGLAVLMVVIFHAGLPLSGGFVGVDVFFVISGFVITSGILKNLTRATFSFAEFYTRRSRRLLPTLSLTLTLVTLGTIFFAPIVSLKVTGRTALAAIFFNANHYLYRSGGYFGAAADTNALLHTWSLSVEEQFYFVFPVLIVGLWRVSKQRHNRMLTGIVALIVASFGINLWLTYEHLVWGLNAPRVAFYTSITRAWEFGFGAILAIVAPRLVVTPKISNVSSWIGLPVVIVSSMVFDHTTRFPGIAALLPVFGTTLLVIGGMTDEPGFLTRRVFAWKPLVRIGDLSYSWYLWHWPAIVFAQASFPLQSQEAMLVGAIGSLPLAWLTERYFENPLRYRKSNSNHSIPKLLIACLVGPVIAWGVQVSSKDRIAQVLPLLQDMHSAEEAYLAIGCDSETPLDYKATTCHWGAKNNPRVVLVGDSNARQHIPALKTVIPRLNAQLFATTLSACPFIDLTLYKGGNKDTRCATWIAQTRRALLVDPPDVVIISNALDRYATRSLYAFADEGTNQLIAQPDAKIAVLSEGVSRLTNELQNRGILVVVIDPIPKFFYDGRLNSKHEGPIIGERCSFVGLAMSSDCIGTRNLNNPATDLIDPTIGQYINQNAQHRADLEINLTKSICPNQHCETADKTQWLYWDPGHLNVFGSERNIPKFVDTLRPLISALGK